MKVVIEENKQIQKFFRIHSMFEEAVKTEIYENIESMIKEKAYKIKTVPGAKYLGKPVFEYKITKGKYFKCRVAYVTKDEEIIVFFLSTNIIKAEFTKEVIQMI